MAGLLGEIGTNVAPSRAPTRNIVRSETRRKVRVLSPPLSQKNTPERNPLRLSEKVEVENIGPTPPAEEKQQYEGFEDDGPVPQFDGDDAFMSDPVPSSPLSKAVERKSSTTMKDEVEDGDDDDDIMDVAQAIGDRSGGTANVNIAGSRPPPPPKAQKTAYPLPSSSSPMAPTPTSDTVDPPWNDVRSKLNVLSSPANDARAFGKVQAPDVVEEDGSLRMFWLDYTEVNGSLCLFGKVKNKTTGAFVSAFVKIDNILRKLYFLPREHRQKHGRVTDEEVDMEDVYTEVDGLMSRLKVGMHKMKPCVRKYAFEIPGIPKEADYLKLLYPYDKPALPVDATGETFSHAFGTNTSLFEQFVLWKNIMGPCWLKIDQADYSAVNNTSWCKFECQSSKPALIGPAADSENLEVPPLTLMALSFRTQLNVKENKQEILVVSARVYEGIGVTDTTPPEKLPCKSFTIVRPRESGYPLGFESETRKQRGAFMLEKSEQFLLSKFLALFERMDPDIIMGHQLQDVDLSILLSRMREKKTPGWHRIGRMKRSEWPKTSSRGGGFFAERHLMSGRLMCDLANDMGRVSVLTGWGVLYR